MIESQGRVFGGPLFAAGGAGRPERPVLRRCITNDATTEAIAVLLSENRRGLALVRDEAVGWTRSMNQYRRGKGTDRQFYLSAWSGTAIRLDRKSNADGRPIIIHAPFLPVCGGVTPDMLPELADEEGRQDGFFDRILFAYTDPIPFADWTKAVISPEAEAGWSGALDRLWDLDFAEGGGDVALALTPEAGRCGRRSSTTGTARWRGAARWSARCRSCEGIAPGWR
jgi:hypothetical protein